MRNNLLFVLLILLCLSFIQCQEEAEAPIDLILWNGQIATIDTQQASAEAIAIRGDRIVQVGDNATIKALAVEGTELIDLQGQFAMPGFIEGHGHFSGLGKSLINLNFLQSKNWDEIVAMVKAKAAQLQPGEWIEGRGWHQEKWDSALDRNVLGYPYHDLLSAATPDNPVILYHASGHSLFANAKAMELAGISIETPNPDGGEIVRSGNGEAIGVFEERAMNSIYAAYQEYLESIPQEEKQARWLQGIELAEAECLRHGITSFQDAGSSFKEIEHYQKLAEAGELDIRLWAMIRLPYAQMKGKLDGFPITNAGNHFFTVNAIKSEVDGALGAFGAWLLRAYEDKPNFKGQNTTPIKDVENIAQLALDHNLQLCVHAIGDRANREVLDIYEAQIKRSENKDLRWRIEHAQHLDTADIPRFRTLGVIASMQGIHCTSDAPFVVKRLGEERSRLGAYPWRSLLDNQVVIANGTDAPVEDVSAIDCFYASVTRKRKDSGLEFFPEQRMTRAEALHSYTLGNAYAAFEDKDKGSLKAGKLADIVVLSKDLRTCSDEEILETKVIHTLVGGKIKYSSK